MKIIFSLSDILFSLWIPPQHHITTKNSDGNPARFFPFIFSRILFLTTKRTRKKNHGTSFLSFLFFFFYLLLLLSLLLIYKELLKYKKTLYAYISLSFHHGFFPSQFLVRQTPLHFQTQKYIYLYPLSIIACGSVCAERDSHTIHSREREAKPNQSKKMSSTKTFTEHTDYSSHIEKKHKKLSQAKPERRRKIERETKKTAIERRERDSTFYITFTYLHISSPSLHLQYQKILLVCCLCLLNIYPYYFFYKHTIITT